jgi:DNA-binding XRE family transcriptional regulator
MNAPNRESNLVKLREKLELTQKQVADALGVTEQTVRNWEQGKAIPRLTIPQMKILCKLLQLPIEEVPDNFGSNPASTEGFPNNN